MTDYERNHTNDKHNISHSKKTVYYNFIFTILILFVGKIEMALLSSNNDYGKFFIKRFIILYKFFK